SRSRRASTRAAGACFPGWSARRNSTTDRTENDRDGAGQALDSGENGGSMSVSPHPALALLDFERRIQSATSNREVAFRAVNDSSQVLRFDQAILWRVDVFS